jgi:hypothetical protein
LCANYSDLGNLKSALACAFDSAAYVRNLTVTSHLGTVTRAERRLGQDMNELDGSQVKVAGVGREKEAGDRQVQPAPLLADSSSRSSNGMGAFLEGSARPRAATTTNSNRLGAAGRNLLQTTFYYWGIEFFTWSTEEFAAEYAASIKGDYSISLLGNGGSNSKIRIS